MYNTITHIHNTKNWIMSMINSRSATVELHGNKKSIKLVRGCPQGRILSPFLWNLVVDSLLNYTKNRIPCDIQGFADDLSLIATLESPSSDTLKGNHAKKSQFHRRLVQREWSKNKRFENSLCCVHLEEEMEIFRTFEN